MQSNKSVSKNEKLSYVAVGIGLSFAALTYSVKAIVTFVGLPSLETIASVIVYLVWFNVLGRYSLHNTRIIKSIAIYEIIYLFVLLMSYLSFSSTRLYFIQNMAFIRQIISVYIPCGAIVFSMTNFNRSIFYIEKVTSISAVIIMASFFMGYTTRWDYQYFGIQLAPLLLISFANYLKCKKLSDFLISLIGLAFTFLGGRQSLIIVILGYFLLYYLHLNKTKKIYFLTSIIFVLIFGIVIYRPIISFLSEKISLENPTYGKALMSLINGELFDASNRTYIYQKSFELIMNNGIKINGFFGDRYLLQNSGQYTSWIAYAHNLFLEIYLDFGLLVGSLISLLFIVNVIVRFSVDHGERKILAAIIFLVSFIRLLVSSSFLIEGLFFIYLGLLLPHDKKKKGNDYHHDYIKARIS